MRKALIYAFLFLSCTLVQSQNKKEVYTGYVGSADFDMGYQIGFNFIYEVKAPYRLILGLEHSGLLKEKAVTYISEGLRDLKDCEICDNDYLGDNYSNTSDMKIWSRAVSLNVGIEIHKNLFALSGITQYQDVVKIDRQTISDTRHTFIDAGIKYLIKLSDSEYLSPTIKYNSRTYSIGLGIVF